MKPTTTKVAPGIYSYLSRAELDELRRRLRQHYPQAERHRREVIFYAVRPELARNIIKYGTPNPPGTRAGNALPRIMGALIIISAAAVLIHSFAVSCGGWIANGSLPIYLWGICP